MPTSNISKQKCVIDLPRSEENKNWTPTVMPPLPPSNAGLSRQYSYNN